MISCGRLNKVAPPPWNYDATYQLTGEHRTGSTPYEESYSYDAAGNRLVKIHDGARTTSAYDAANQLIYSEDASGRTTYTFDADGNQELVVEPSGDRTTTSRDYENRTTLVRLPAGVRNTMAYEPDGLRVTLEESTGTKKFIWDDQNYLAETDDADTTQVVYTNEPRLYGNLVSQRRGSDTHWHQFDAIGSTRELTDASEVITDTRLYDAWGLQIASTETTVFPFTYVGQSGYYCDLDTASQYVRARYYKSSSGRWCSTDPLGVAVDVNLFRYCTGNPVLSIDPSGFVKCPGGTWHYAGYERGGGLVAVWHLAFLRFDCGKRWRVGYYDWTCKSGIGFTQDVYNVPTANLEVDYLTACAGFDASFYVSKAGWVDNAPTSDDLLGLSFSGVSIGATGAILSIGIGWFPNGGEFDYGIGFGLGAYLSPLGAADAKLLGAGFRLAR